MTIARFWREVPSRYRLEASKCGVCGRVFLPTRKMCPVCHRKSIGKMETIKLSGKGEVYTYSILHSAQHGFDDQVPYVMAIVKMDEGVKLTGQIVDVDPSDVEIGMRVRSDFRKIGQDGQAGIVHYGHKFVPDYEK